MASTREIYVVAAARTAIGTFGGALKDVPLTQLATTAVRVCSLGQITNALFEVGGQYRRSM